MPFYDHLRAEAARLARRRLDGDPRLPLLAARPADPARAARFGLAPRAAAELLLDRGAGGEPLAVLELPATEAAVAFAVAWLLARDDERELRALVLGPAAGEGAGRADAGSEWADAGPPRALAGAA